MTKPILIFIMMIAGLTALAEPPGLIDYQGRIAISDEAFDGTGYFKLAISDAGNTNVWTHDGTSVGVTTAPSGILSHAVSSGVFSLMLGDTALGMTALTPDIFTSDTRYLRVWFATTPTGPFSEMLPAQRLTAVPYALSAGGMGSHAIATNLALNGNWLAGDGESEGLYVDSVGNVGVGTRTPERRLHVEGDALVDGDMRVGGDIVFAVPHAADSLALSAGTNAYCRFSGEGAGVTNSGYHIVGFGYAAARGNRGNNVVALGQGAAQDNIGSHVSAIGLDAVRENSGEYVSAFGSLAAKGNRSSYVDAFGTYAAMNNTGTHVSAIGHLAANENGGNRVVAVGASAAKENTADDVTAIGWEAGRQNSGNFVNAIGYQAAWRNTNDFVNILGAWSNLRQSPPVESTYIGGDLVLYDPQSQGATPSARRLAFEDGAGASLLSSNSNLTVCAKTVTVELPDSAPAMHIKGGLRVDGTNTAALFVGDGSGLSNLPWQNVESVPIAMDTDSSDDFQHNGTVAMSGNIRLSGNYLSGDGGNEGLSVDDMGRVGVGVADPGVNGMDIRWPSGASEFRVKSQADEARVSIDCGSSSDSRIRIQKSASTLWQIAAGASNAEALRFHDADGGVPTLLLTQNGNVGINNSSPTNALAIQGNGSLSGSLSAGGHIVGNNISQMRTLQITPPSTSAWVRVATASLSQAGAELATFFDLQVQEASSNRAAGRVYWRVRRPSQQGDDPEQSLFLDSLQREFTDASMATVVASNVPSLLAVELWLRLPETACRVHYQPFLLTATSSSSLLLDSGGTVSATLPVGAEATCRARDATVSALSVTGGLTMNGSPVSLEGAFISHDGENEGLYVNADGLVGVGTNNPASLLHVVGEASVEGDMHVGGTIHGNADGLVFQPQGDIPMYSY
jgi:hypothetical protein